MLNFTNAKILKTIIHFVGNKNSSENILLSENIIKIDKDIEAILLTAFVSPFKNAESNDFDHAVNIKHNIMFDLCKNIFKNPELNFVQTSKDITKVLYDCSTHHNIKSGELCIIYFSQVIYNDISTNAIGIFKSENKESFLRYYQKGNGYDIVKDQGVNLNKIDKGCLIIDTNNELNYSVLSIDNSHNNSIQYWKEDFLNIKPSLDGYHFTKDFLSLTKDFVSKQFPEEFEITKTDQIDYLNKSVEYFKSNTIFNRQEFEKEIFHDKNVINSFRTFSDKFHPNTELDLIENFEISPQAVKRQAKFFKNILKLDKNFHIYIHGDKELIEHGVEKDGRKFYKIYYNNET